MELGDRHDEEHLALGRHAGERLDKCYIVTPERVPALVEGVEAVGGVAETASSYLAARAAVDLIWPVMSFWWPMIYPMY